MNRSLRSAVLVLMWSGLGVASPALASDRVIHAGRLLDGVSAAPRTQASILVRDDRIVSVESGFTSPAGAEVIDLTHATVLPGLIDCHTHVTYRRGGFAEWLTGSDLDDALHGVASVRKLLLGGFTSIRNVGADGGTDLALKHAIERGDIIGPRMWVSLEGLGPTGGHSDPANGVDPTWHNDRWGPSVIDGPEQAIQAVREHKRRGADVIKIMPSGGVGGSGDATDPQHKLMTDDEIRAVIVPIIRKMLHDAYLAGVKIAFGTDVTGLIPFDANAREFAVMVGAGMTPSDAIFAATRNAADLVGASDRIGSIQPGRFADIVAVAGDPLADITELERMKFVMKGGEVVRDDLHAAQR